MIPKFQKLKTFWKFCHDIMGSHCGHLGGQSLPILEIIQQWPRVRKIAPASTLLSMSMDILMCGGTLCTLKSNNGLDAKIKFYF